MGENVSNDLPVLVLGGTGRVGSAVVDRLTAHGQQVVVVSRRPPQQPRALVRHCIGDVRDLATALAGVRVQAAVVAVTPFTAPPASFDGFDGDFYVRIVEELESMLSQGSRVVDVVVTAIARLRDGTVVGDHEDLFPAWLRPFSDAHARGADRLEASSTLAGTVLIPAAGLGVQAAASSAEPVLVREPVAVEDATAALDHGVLARAVVDRLSDTAMPGRLLVRAPSVVTHAASSAELS